jgi:hypothetical protein
MKSALQKNLIILIISIIVAIFFSFKQGYGNDLDIYGLISTYINLTEKGIYNTSRYYGHPLGELIIGFLSYHYGAQTVVIFCTFSYFLSIILIFEFFKKNTKKNSLFFFLLVISNPLLLFNNINPSDFSLSLVFFSFGLYLINTKVKIISPIFFGFAIATRAEYAIYVIITILFYFLYKKKEHFNSIILLIYSGLISLLFYLTIFFEKKLSLNFIQADGGPDINIYELTPRFLYKIFITLNPLSILIILFIFCYNYIKSKKIIIKNDEKLSLLIIIANLIIFFFIPSKIAILTVSVIFIYLLIFKYFNLKIIFLIIFLNLISWFYTYEIIEIKYKNEPVCGRIVATDVNFNFMIKNGYFDTLTKDNEKRIKCLQNSADINNNKFVFRKEKLIKGEKMKLN